MRSRKRCTKAQMPVARKSETTIGGTAVKNRRITPPKRPTIVNTMTTMSSDDSFVSPDRVVTKVWRPAAPVGSVMGFTPQTNEQRIHPADRLVNVNHDA